MYLKHQILGNKIEDAGISALSEALKANTSLTYIDVGRFSIMKAMWSKNDKPVILTNLKDNQFGYVGAIAFSETLKKNTTLTSVHFWGKDEWTRKKVCRWSFILWIELNL